MIAYHIIFREATIWTTQNRESKKKRREKNADYGTASVLSNEVLKGIEREKSKDEAYKAILCLKENRLKNPISNVQF